VTGALSDFNQALALDPNFAAAYNNRGYDRQQLGDIDGALADYEKAISLDPGEAYYYNNRGRSGQSVIGA
jgi:Flp pilus assembly protein TadD